jgi:hypothetical protein
MVKCIWVLAIMAALVGVASAATETIETRPAARDVAVDITNVKGSVEVLGWDQGTVEVTAELGSNSDVLEFDGTEQRLTIKIVNPNRRPKEADLRVRVPFGASLDVDCVSAKIEVEEVEGDLNLRAVSGKVEAIGVAGRVRAETVSGSVDVEGRPISVEAKTVSGKVDIQAASNKPLRVRIDDDKAVRTQMEWIKASTVSGSIDIVSIEVGQVECEAVSGSIDFTGAIAPYGVVDMETHSGSIDLEIPADTAAAFDLNTFSGNIKSDFGGTVKKPHIGPGRSLEFVSDSGSARIRAQAFSGSISVKYR